MATQDKYIKDFESNMKKYGSTLSTIDSQIKNYKAHNKGHLLAEREKLKQTYAKAEDIFKKLKSSSAENFEDIKGSATEISEALNKAFHDFSHLLTMDQLHHAKDEVAMYGADKLSQVEDYVKRNPLTAAGWAFGLGFVVGIFLTRSK